MMFDYNAVDFLIIAHMDPNWAHMNKNFMDFFPITYYLKFLYINNKLKC